jgi:Kef-type K+ transport system membrane component KefB
MLNFSLFLAFVYFFTYLVGRFVEKIRVPWVFAALLLGFLLAVRNPFATFTSSGTFTFLGELGMYFLLFMIGFELDLEELKKSGAFIVRSTFFIIFLEAVFGTVLIHFVFGYGVGISFLVSLSFATVGEAILLPILDEFGAVNTKLGQSIIGIGTLDDIIEVCLLLVVGVLLGSGRSTSGQSLLVLGSLFVLFVMTWGLVSLRGQSRKFSFHGIENLFLFVLFVFFLFIGVGEYAHASAVAALFAGIGLKTFIPKERLEFLKSEIRTMCYGFFAPLFFVWVGVSLDVEYLFSSPVYVLLVVAVSNMAKILGSWLMGRHEMGTRQSVLLGIGLSVRFSTSIVIVKLLFEGGLIGSDLYSIIVASSIAFMFIAPVLFANLIVRWKVVPRGG